MFHSGLRLPVHLRLAVLIMALAGSGLAGYPVLAVGETVAEPPSPSTTDAPVSAASVGLMLGGGIDTGWHFLALEGGLCVLEQPVADFGTARFLGGSGADLIFEVLGHRALGSDGPVTVEETAPIWSPSYPTSRSLGLLAPASGSRLNSVEPVVSQLLLSLYKGFDLTLSPLGWTGSGDTAAFAVKLTGARIRTHYEDFLRCARNPHSRSWADVERTRISYSASGWKLSQDDLVKLEALAAYAVADPDVRAIYVDGYTDTSGTPSRNLELSRRRAEAVSQALESMGVAPDRLVMRYHGERYPVADNDSESGRADNRRTTIRLERVLGATDTDVARR